MEIMFAANRFNRTSVALPIERNSGMDSSDLADLTASVAVAAFEPLRRGSVPRHLRLAIEVAGGRRAGINYRF
jgi:hypothetical protein